MSNAARERAPPAFDAAPIYLLQCIWNFRALRRVHPDRRDGGSTSPGATGGRRREERAPLSSSHPRPRVPFRHLRLPVESAMQSPSRRSLLKAVALGPAAAVIPV